MPITNLSDFNDNYHTGCTVKMSVTVNNSSIEEEYTNWTIIIIVQLVYLLLSKIPCLIPKP